MHNAYDDNASRIVGVLVAEVKLKKATDMEEYRLLSSKHDQNTQLAYILSIGVEAEYRRTGIATLLLDNLLDYLHERTHCKAIYLHVLCTNVQAIRFYEKHKFTRRILLPKYYTIRGELHDGYCYVMYMRDGQAPLTLTYPFLICFLVCVQILFVAVLFALNFYAARLN